MLIKQFTYVKLLPECQPKQDAENHCPGNVDHKFHQTQQLMLAREIKQGLTRFCVKRLVLLIKLQGK